MDQWKQYYKNRMDEIEIPDSPFIKETKKKNKNLLSREWINLVAMITLVFSFRLAIPAVSEYRSSLADSNISGEKIKEAIPELFINSFSTIYNKTAGEFRKGRNL